MDSLNSEPSSETSKPSSCTLQIDLRAGSAVLLASDGTIWSGKLPVSQADSHKVSCWHLTATLEQDQEAQKLASAPLLVLKGS